MSDEYRIAKLSDAEWLEYFDETMPSMGSIARDGKALYELAPTFGKEFVFHGLAWHKARLSERVGK